MYISPSQDNDMYRLSKYLVLFCEQQNFTGLTWPVFCSGIVTVPSVAMLCPEYEGSDASSFSSGAVMFSL